MILIDLDMVMFISHMNEREKMRGSVRKRLSQSPKGIIWSVVSLPCYLAVRYHRVVAQ